ncbi:MAG: FAD-dependent oxidoreductase [Planctomycetes bacterium]|nr:FAD-dependent oxidoreductase [Planctomycetota bacterium]
MLPLALPVLIAVLAATVSSQSGVLIEAESFADPGGFVVDTQFVDQMGSPYLLAHGLGTPVADAVTTVTIPGPGRYRVLARTLDWVARFGAPGAPGRLRVVVGGAELPAELGVDGADWDWHELGAVELPAGDVELRLRDTTGFDGRCDALLLTRERERRPPGSGAELATWRRAMLGLPDVVPTRGRYDLVVVGGGYAGIAAALSATRMGCRVALVQDREVLGGNGSSEVRVWAKGGTRRGLFPQLGEIVEEFADHASASPGRADEFGDDRKMALVHAEPHIDLLLGHRVDRVEQHDGHIVAVEAFAVRTGARVRLAGALFADCTGHGNLGALAGADLAVQRTGHLGASNMWRWEHGGEPAPFPATPWALQLGLDDFPYPNRGLGEWFWESGFDKHPIDDLEAIRDWNLRAVFGAFQAMKSGPRRDEHADARLVWVAYVAGTRESRQLLGDVVLTREDIVERRAFDDGCVPTTWDIDLHYPKEEYAKRYADDPFISRAHFDRAVDREHGYPVPYRCFYSRNLDNLFMAGRCISVTHEALGTVRVMRTGGMIGEVVGKAASLCVRHGCSPRAVYEEHLAELLELLRLPGRARRATPAGPIEIPPPPPDARAIDPRTLSGIVVDDDRARLEGTWTASTSEPGYVGTRYLHDGDRAKGSARAIFTVRAREAGRYRLEITWRAGGSRAAAVPVTIRTRDGSRVVHVDQRRAPDGPDGFAPLGEVELRAGVPVEVIVSNEGTAGHVIVDAVRAVRCDGA